MVYLLQDFHGGTQHGRKLINFQAVESEETNPVWFTTKAHTVSPNHKFITYKYKNLVPFNEVETDYWKNNTLVTMAIMTSS